MEKAAEVLRNAYANLSKKLGIDPGPCEFEKTCLGITLDGKNIKENILYRETVCKILHGNRYIPASGNKALLEPCSLKKEYE